MHNREVVVDGCEGVSQGKDVVLFHVAKESRLSSHGHCPCGEDDA